MSYCYDSVECYSDEESSKIKEYEFDHLPSHYGPIPTVSLSNNVEMPMLGLGTTHSSGYYHDVVLYALRKCNYRLIDTAKRYGVERELGIAWKESGVQRDDLFLCSKLWPVDFGGNVREACRKSCERLQTDYLDLYMTHFPTVPNWFHNPKETKEETWRQLELLYDEGILRSIGVSNYDVTDLDELLDYCSVPPHVNQYEFHPWYNPQQLREYCIDNDILFTGYCPIAKGKYLDETKIITLAEKYGKSPAQICLRWSIENGVPAIPKSKEYKRIYDNRDIFDFNLSPEDLDSLSTISETPKKLISFDDLQEKFDLPDGYKLKGRIYGVPKTTRRPDDNLLFTANKTLSVHRQAVVI